MRGSAPARFGLPASLSRRATARGDRQGEEAFRTDRCRRSGLKLLCAWPVGRRQVLSNRRPLPEQAKTGNTGHHECSRSHPALESAAAGGTASADAGSHPGESGPEHGLRGRAGAT